MLRYHRVEQGTPEWLSLRLRHFTGSEAPAMMGVSPYLGRNELLRQKATGMVPEVDATTQVIFDAGHAAEAAIRPAAERLIGEELFPGTCSRDVDGLPLLASLDGLTMDGSIVWENKLKNAETIAYIAEHGEPPLHHVWQLEHQLLVTGAEKALFTCGTDGEDFVRCWYESRPERREAILAGWKRFAEDLANYTLRPDEYEFIGVAPDRLPALHVAVSGRILASNIAEWRDRTLEILAGIPRDLRTDQDFANAEETIRWAKEALDRIAVVKDAVLAQMPDVEQMFRSLDDIGEALGRTVKDLDGLVKVRKDNIRLEMVQKAAESVRAHYDALALELGAYAPTMPSALLAELGASIKGTRTAKAAAAKLDSAVAQAKIAADRDADRLRTARRLFADAAARVGVDLWPDGPSLAQTLDEDALLGVIARRVNAHRSQGSRPTSKASKTLSLEAICARISPLGITKAGLAQLGFAPLPDGGYLEADFPKICAALVATLQSAAKSEMADAA
ncbi:Heme peroxidase [Acidithiobacillus caldus]|uniref:YqaJ viral recombinase family protein n=1 Tax=Acidithiobacillus caldus TaxID=33059 RepID=UPI001C0769FF|nr:YqaJ viral recombinase family protein [Acidithiobacillus caldus]MBU2782034.1 Heme peroxidase [Acidithiobacillus caldus]